MSTMTVALELPRDLLGALEVPQTQMGARLRELIASLSQHSIDYFTASLEELKIGVYRLLERRSPEWPQCREVARAAAWTPRWENG